jgi:hypothetical protein
LATIWLAVAVALPAGIITGLAISLENWSVLLAYLILAAVAVPVSLISLSAGGTTLDEAPE